MKPTRAIFGFHAVLARLRADPASVTEIYLDEDRKDARASTRKIVGQQDEADPCHFRISRGACAAACRSGLGHGDLSR